MIGVFDSGIGGLSALAPLTRLMPSADILYYADTAALPLGVKRDEEILERLLLALRFFEKAAVSGVLLACGTASGIYKEKCKEPFTFHIIDVISPTATAVRSLPKRDRVLLLATPAAVRSGIFASALARRDTTLFSIPCPRLVRLSEKGNASPARVERAMGTAPLLHPDAVVLGCTHFSHLKPAISTLLPRARLIDAATCAAAAAASRFENAGKGTCRFLVTGDPTRFEARAEEILARPVRAEKIKP